ncbi:GTP-binding protein, partial [Salmonella enterica subsp. enterica serovar Kentucky]|nr:GTP-binding protein [Salmonella enterica subsp. enterica serovar Kentucky]
NRLKRDFSHISIEIPKSITQVIKEKIREMIIHGDFDLGQAISSQLFNTSGFMLEENVLASQPRFHFIADKQNDVSSIVVELDYP